MRLDKWLWAARFFKTRALAQKHIELGRVLVNGAKVKNSKNIAAGDVLHLTLKFAAVRNHRTGVKPPTPPRSRSAAAVP